MANQDEIKPIQATPIEARPVEVLRALPTEQSLTAAPVVLSPQLPAMEKVGAVKTVFRNTLLPLMGAGAQQTTGGEGRMAAVPTQPAAPSPLSGKPQEPKAVTVVAVGAPADGYIRVEVHVENGRLSVTGVKQVPGPLAMPSAVIRGYAYEVTLDDQQIALGSIPDVGVRRAFANSNVEGPQGKHYFINVPSFDFFVRIPKGHFQTANLPKLNIVLHQVQDAPDRLTSLAPLQAQPGVKTVEAGRLTGIQLDQIPATVRPQFQQILGETETLK